MTDAKLTLIGGPTVLIELAGYRLLTDPTFGPPGRYPSGRIELEKTAGPALPASALGPLDAVLLSHDQHADNLDPAGRTLLGTVARTFTTLAGAERLGGAACGLAPFETVRLDKPGRAPLFVTATPARHGPVGIEPISGDVVGFLLGTDQPGDAVYVTGDTVWYDGIAEVARRFAPKLVILFAGGAEPRGAFHMTMDSNDAIETAHAFPKAAIAAAHTEGWAHFTESAAELARSFETLGLGERLLRLEPGRPAALSL